MITIYRRIEARSNFNDKKKERKKEADYYYSIVKRKEEEKWIALSIDFSNRGRT